MSTKARLTSLALSTGFSATCRSTEARAAATSGDEESCATSASRCACESTPPAFVLSLSTNCAGVIESGNCEMKAGRMTNSSAKAFLLFSNCVCQSPTPTTTFCPIRCVSGRNCSRRTAGTRSVCVPPRVELPVASPKAVL